MGFWLQNNHIDISDKTVDFGAFKTIDYREVTDEVIASIAGEPKIKFVQVSEDLPDKACQIIDRILEVRPDITFRIYGLHNLMHYDISYLHKMAHLKHLSISCHLRNNPDLIDFDLIKGLPLKSLVLDAFDMKDYSFIKELPEDIERLTIMADGMGSSVIFDCKWLLQYKELSELFLGKKAKKNLNCLKDMSSLTSLSLRGIKLTDFSFLKEIGLERLALLWNSNDDLDELGELASLKEIELWRINKLSNIDFLEKLTSLETVILKDLKHVTGLPDLSGHKELKRIVLDNTGVKPDQLDARLMQIVKWSAYA